MKLVTFEVDGRREAGVLRGKAVYRLQACEWLLAAQGAGNQVSARNMVSMADLLAAGPESLKAVERAVRQYEQLIRKPGAPIAYPLDQVKLCAPVQPRKLLCMAGNYAEHIREGGLKVRKKAAMMPRVFMKPPSTCVIGPGDPVRIAKTSNHVDYEAELGVVIGPPAKHVSAKRALDHVAGYTVVNDISERDLKLPMARGKEPMDGWFRWLNGKWFDTFAPMGPCIVTTDEIRDPHRLRITLKVNGRLRQNANTGSMLYSIAEIIAWCSDILTLEPGDVIATGTPAGVGSSTGTFLKRGDVVEAEIQGIGALRSPIA